MRPLRPNPPRRLPPSGPCPRSRTPNESAFRGGAGAPAGGAGADPELRPAGFGEGDGAPDSAASVSRQFVEASASAMANEKALERAEVTPAEIRDLMAYAGAYGALADEYEAMGQFLHHTSTPPATARAAKRWRRTTTPSAWRRSRATRGSRRTWRTCAACWGRCAISGRP